MNDRPQGGPLGDIVVRVALIEARRRMAAGVTPAEAAALVCRGAWAPYRRAVERQLRAGPLASPPADDDPANGWIDRLPDRLPHAMVAFV